jgi:hypothetical protein
MTDFFGYANALRKVVTVELPGLDRKIDVKEMSCADRDQFEIKLAEVFKKDARGCRALYVRYSCFWHGTDEYIFSDDDIQKLNDSPSKPLKPLFDAAAKLNSDQQDFEELKKN